MKVILRTDVSELGKRGDVLDVADGFARNYLVPKGLAMKATDGLQRGMTATDKPSGWTAATVRLVPSMVIEPFSTT